jgi:hypothetical protein
MEQRKGGGGQRMGDLVSTRDGMEDRVRRGEVWRFGLNQGWNRGQRMGDLVSTRDGTKDRVL